jgi:hypothetical protein
MKNRFIPRCENLEGRCLLTVMPLGPSVPEGFVMPAADTAAEVSPLSLPNISFVVQQQDNCSVLICHVHSPQSWLVALPGGEGEWTDRSGLVRLTLPSDLRTVRLSLNDASTVQTAILRVELNEDGSTVLQHEWEPALSPTSTSLLPADSTASAPWSALPRTLLDDQLSAQSLSLGLNHRSTATTGSHGDSLAHSANNESQNDADQDPMIHADNPHNAGTTNDLASIGRLGSGRLDNTHATSMSAATSTPLANLHRLAKSTPSPALDQDYNSNNNTDTHSDATASSNAIHSPLMDSPEPAEAEEFSRFIPDAAAATDEVLAQLALLEPREPRAVAARAIQPVAATMNAEGQGMRDEVEAGAEPDDARWQVLGASLATVALLGGAYGLERQQRKAARGNTTMETNPGADE